MGETSLSSCNNWQRIESLKALRLEVLFVAIVFTMTGMILGCARDNDPEALLEDYLSRVRNATGLQAASAIQQRSTLERYPRLRERQLPLTELRIGFLDFLALNECGLQGLVGERNSGLGRIMPVSRRLVYEHRFLIKARNCWMRTLQEPSRGEDFVAELGTTVDTKIRELPKAYWNATFGSPEFERLFSFASGPLEPGKRHQSTARIERALRFLLELQPGLGTAGLSIDMSALEGHYQQLASRRLGGEILKGMDLLRTYLDAVSETLERALTAPPICHQKRPSTRAKTLRTVFHKSYIGKVQPYLALVYDASQRLLSPINQLAQSQQAYMPAAFSVYFEQHLRLGDDASVWAGFNRAIHRHTRAWQQLNEICGMMPGESSAALRQ